ncbi:conserved hypothetical protein [Vibrio chagasii]|nr:conserved hypothetical protein [Vibrio chagasii]CAH6878786.1 conserved hypothetical protein [Vibrio chagasii]CAH7124651.1 conserved hypothetical protein [Vibrio chagasii]CAH7170914.1 conserved hypothetical protein [Vibrio chagasii]CAH7180968.1 conserved hypothetical protein [Vibrio chagasii]
MDTSDLIIDYRAGDFSDVFRQLLPKGGYWQDTENEVLKQVIDGLAKDFKQTHDDIELSLLTDLETRPFGWKVSDYQHLLNTIASQGSGRVFDDARQPNLIYGSLRDSFRHHSRQAWKAFEGYRLPHTEIAWIYQSTLDVQHHMANYRHIRNEHRYEVTS